MNIKKFKAIVQENFVHKELFLSYLNELEEIKELQAKKSVKWTKFSKGLIWFCAVSFVAALLFKKVDFILVGGITFLLLGSVVNVALGRILRMPLEFYRKFNLELKAKSYLLADLAKLAVDKGSDKILQNLTQSIMKNENNDSFQDFLDLLNNYTEFHEDLNRNNEIDKFLNNLGAVNPYLESKKVVIEKSNAQKYL